MGVRGVTKMTAVVILGVVLSTTGLAGCAFSDPRIDAAPPPAAIDDSLKRDLDQAAQDTQALWNTAMTAANTGGVSPEVSPWSHRATTLKLQWQVLTGPNPLSRVPAGITATPGTDTTGVPIGDVDTKLAALRDADLERAGRSTSTTALFWASLAASAEQMRVCLESTVYPDPTAADPAITVQTTDEASAVAQLLTRYDQAMSSIRTAVGFIAPDDPDHARFVAIGDQLAVQQAELLRSAPGAAATEPVTEGIYEVPAGRDKQASLELLAQAQRGLTQAAGVWVASAADPKPASAILVSTATLGSPWGIGVAVWPGWPDAE
ncbi:MAG: hypothetical protein LBV06_05525 [Propionibacteriaceae bacterium]|nr:hypothetical protein [Propionibacteriaceae bacterium]